MIDRLFDGSRTIRSLRASPIAATFAFIGFLTSPFALATDGTINHAFGAAGVVSFGSSGSTGTKAEYAAGAIQPDGKLLIAVNVHTEADPSTVHGELHRLNPDGQLDATFGASQGYVSLSSSAGPIKALAVQSSGRIVLSSASAKTLRLNPDGTPDSTFVSLNTAALAIAVEADDSLVFIDSGTVTWESKDGAPAYTSSIPNIAGVSMALQPDGKVLVGLDSGLDPSVPQAALKVIRFNRDGSLDAAFGSGGIAAVTVTSNTTTLVYCTGIAVDVNGKILLVGPNSAGPGVNVARLLANGAPDTTFGTAGVVAATSSTIQLYGYSIVSQPDGKVLVGGEAFTQDDVPTFLIRFSSSGVLDSTFGAHGIALGPSLPLPALIGVTYSFQNYPGQITLQTDGSALVFGREESDTAGNGFEYYGTAVTSFLLNDPNDDGTTDAWEVFPSAPAFASQTNVPLSAVLTSSPITIAGLGGGIKVPASVQNGQMSLNGSSTFTDTALWVGNGDTLALRQTSSVSPGVTTSTTLTIGGISLDRNSAFPIGMPGKGTFISVTAQAPQITAGAGSFNIDDSIAIGATITSIVATDSTAGALTYSIIQGNTASAFAIDAAGKVTVATPLHSSQVPQYVLSISVANSLGVRASANVTVNVSAAAVTPPVTPPSTPPAPPTAGSSSGGGSLDFPLLALLLVLSACTAMRKWIPTFPVPSTHPFFRRRIST